MSAVEGSVSTAPVDVTVDVKKKIYEAALRLADKSGGKGKYKDYRLRKTILIGRGDVCDIQIDLNRVSRMQMRVIVDNENLDEHGRPTYYAKNESATNPKYSKLVRGNVEEQLPGTEPNDKPKPLYHGDILKIMDKEFEFRLIEKEVNSKGPGADDKQSGIYTFLCGAPPMSTDGGAGDKETGGCIIN